MRSLKAIRNKNQIKRETNFSHISAGHIMKELKFNQEDTEEDINYKTKISEVESSNLKRVFRLFCHIGGRKYKQGEDKWFDASDIRKIFEKIGKTNIYQSLIDQMIWEVDEDLNAQIEEYDFELMYKRNIEDKTGLEPYN